MRARYTIPVLIALAVGMLAAGTEVSAAPPKVKAPEATVNPQALYYDARTAEVWGSALPERIRQSIVVKNGIAIRSGVYAHWIDVYNGPAPWTPIDTTNPAAWLGGCNNPLIVASRIRFGAALVLFWSDTIETGAALPVASLSGFKPGRACAVVPTGTAIEQFVDVHETGHALGLGHQAEAWSTGPGVVAKARAAMAAGVGTVMCTDCIRLPVFSGATYAGKSWGGLLENNTAVANTTASRVAATAPGVRDPDRSCTNDVETVCLFGRYRARVQWASVSDPATDFAYVMSASGSQGVFTTGITVVAVTSQGVMSIKGGRASAAYRVVVTDTMTGQVRAWQTLPGKVLTVTGATF